MRRSKYFLPNSKHSKRQSGRKSGSRDTTRSKSVVKTSGVRTDKSEAGFDNSFVPGLVRSKFHGKLRYGAASLTFSASTASVGTYVFSANGLFDPNITGGGLQPAGFSQLMSLYEHYTVTHSKISVVFTNNTGQPVVVGIALEPDVTGSSDVSNMLELPFEQMVQLEAANVYGSSKTLSMTADLSKYFGVPVMKETALYRGDAGANPPEQAYFHLKAYSVKGATAEIFIQVKIETDAWFTEPRELGPSLQKAIMDLVLAEEKARWTLTSKSQDEKQRTSGVMFRR